MNRHVPASTTFSFWHDGRVVTFSLAGLALIIYALGFRAASFSWFDAVGAASAHVVPGAIAGLSAWQLQYRIEGLARRYALVLHFLLATATGIVWLIMMLAITYAAKPDIVAHVSRAAGPSTVLSGMVLYVSIAFIFALLASRRRAEESEAALARAQLTAIRARVEPHFLYNTLETISGLVRDDPFAAESALGKLGRILRRVLEDPFDGAPDALATLSEELSLVRDYLEIERLRFGDRLRIVEKIDTDTQSLGVPSFSLQCLVENAVIHGLSDKPEGGVISLSAQRHGDTLVLTVADDGVGVEEETLTSGGLGLGLLRKRLDTHFAGRASFDVAAAPGHGVSIRVSVPAIEVE